MQLNIANFVKKLIPSFEKNDVETEMENALEAISAIVNAYTNLNQLFVNKQIKAKANKDIVKAIYKEWVKFKPKGVRLSNNENLAQDTLNLFKNIKVNGDFILDEIDTKLSTMVASTGLNAYKANLIRAVSHYSFLTQFALDLCNYMLTNEANEAYKEGFDKGYNLNKKQIENVEKNIWIYARVVAAYADEPKAFEEKIKSIEDIYLPKDNIDDVVNAYNADKIDFINNIPNNFIGSPIFTIRLFFAERAAKRYHRLKEERKLLELRYLHLKVLLEKGETDVNLEKEIKMLQDKITSIDYELSKIEQSIED